MRSRKNKLRIRKSIYKSVIIDVGFCVIAMLVYMVEGMGKYGVLCRATYDRHDNIMGTVILPTRNDEWQILCKIVYLCGNHWSARVVCRLTDSVYRLYRQRSDDK